MKNNKLLAAVMITIALIATGAALTKASLVKNDSSSGSTNSTTQTTLGGSEAMHEEYPKVPEDNRFIREPASDTITMYKEGTGIIFLGFKECPWCQQMAPLLNEAAEAEEATVHYLDIRKERADNTPYYQQLISTLTPYLPKDENGGVRISVPDVSFVKDGEIIWRYEMDATTEDERTPEAYWTNERKERAVTQFREQMRKLK